LDQRNRRAILALIASVASLALASARAAAQAGGTGNSGSLVDHLGLDRLQIVSLGGSAGWIAPSQVDPAKIVAVSADYGEAIPNWRIVVNASFWASQYRPSVVQTFVDSLNRRLSESGTSRIAASRVSLYDVTFGADARYVPTYSGELKPFVGVGLALHVINAGGPLIQGTFVERALDEITAGTYVTSGLSFKIVKHFGLEGSVRGDLLSGFRSTQARVGATYYFGTVRGTTAAGNSARSATRKVIE
jgi:hypothetical protein